VRDKHQQIAAVTVIGQENLPGELTGKKLACLPGPGPDPLIPWFHEKLEELIQNCLTAGCFMSARFSNPDKPGQNITIMIEPYIESEELIILGAGHIAKALAVLAELMKLKLTIIDDRPEFAVRERFPGAERVICSPYIKIAEFLNPGPRSYVVVVTQGHKSDLTCVREVMKYPVRYLGVIGSTRKTTLIKEKLREAGYGQNEIDNIYMPIGLDIGAKTPEEIAVSIAAELIKVRHGGLAASLSGDHPSQNANWSGGNPADLIKKAVEMAGRKIPAAVATIVDTQGSTPRKAGAHMIIERSGAVYGTVGGGQGETLVRAEALKIIRDGRPRLLKVDMNADIKDELEMICGGSIKVFIEPVGMFAGGFTAAGI